MCGLSVTVRTTKFRGNHGQPRLVLLSLQTKAPAAPGADAHADHAEEVFYPTKAEAEAAALKLGCTGIGRLLRPRLLPVAMRTLTRALLICPVMVAARVDAFEMPADESAPEQLQHVCYRAVWEASVVQEHTKWNLGSGLRARTMIRAKLLRQLNLRCRPVCTVTVAVRRCCRPGLRRYLHSSLLSLIFKL